MSRLETVELHHQAPQHFLLRFTNNSAASSNNKSGTVAVCSLSHSGAGGDELARSCIFPLLLKQKQIRVVLRDPNAPPTTTGDAAATSSSTGFVAASLNLADLTSDLAAVFDSDVRALLSHLFRKQCALASHGAVLVAKVAKVITQGRRALALKLGPAGVAAVAPLPASADDVALIRAFGAGEDMNQPLGLDFEEDLGGVYDNDNDDDDENINSSSGNNKKKSGKKQEHYEPSIGDTVSARVLYLASDNGLVACTVQRGIVERAPMTREELHDSFARCGCNRPGRVVRATILLHCNSEEQYGVKSHIAVAEVVAAATAVINDESSSNNEPSVICYVRLGPVSQASKLREQFPVRSQIDVLLDFVPNSDMIDALPFCLGQRRELAQPFLPLRAADPSVPCVPYILSAAASSSSSTSSPAEQFTALHNLFRPLLVNFQRCDPLYVDRYDRNGDGGDGDFNDDDHQGQNGDDGNNPRIRRRDLEEAIDAFERQGEVVPATPDGFRKLLLSGPQSSYVWVRFMAHYVGLSRIDEAKDIAEEALRTIGVRELDERLNVWTAYMNLENLHGTAESLTAVFNRALLNSDNQLAVHERLAHIFKATRKKEQLLQLCRTMTGKFATEPRVWELLGQAYIEQDKREALRRTVRQIQTSSALKVADKTLVLQHLAVHEYRCGQPTHGRALFETLVSQKTKRSDVWNVFLDQELVLLARRDPAVSVKEVRKLFQRAASVQLPPRAMQQLMARFLKFEQQHGTAADVDRVKESAQQYVQQRLAAASGVVDSQQQHNSNNNDNGASADDDFGGADDALEVE